MNNLNLWKGFHPKVIKACLLTVLLLSGSWTLLRAQSKSISGTVVDENNLSLVGVTVRVMGSNQGALTADDGSFAIQATAADTLLFSYIGYERQSIAVGSQTTIDVQMVPDMALTEEVVVLGYGQTQNKRVTSIAANTISAGRIADLPVSRPEQLLQGNTPGVVVSQNSGSPGTPLTIRLRGVSTAGGAQPLILVDGVQVPDLNFLNSNDIANISILKDAAAAAIYGARGGNGVVLVETRKGTRTGDGPSISFNGSTGFQNLLRKPELMDRDQYVAYYNDFAAGNPDFEPISDADRAKLANTDWYDVVFDENAPMHNYNVSVADGGDRYSYYLSGGLFDQQGLVGGDIDKSRYQRYNVKLNLEVDVLDNLTIRGGADIVQVDRDYLLENQAGTFSAVMNYLPGLPSIYPVYDDAGNIYDMGQFGTGVVNGVNMPFSGVGAVTNPMASLNHSSNETMSTISMYNLGANWEIIDGLSLNASYARYEDRSDDRRFTEMFDYREAGHELFNETADYNETNFYSRYTQFESNLRYKLKTSEDHSLDLIGGISVLEFYGSQEARAGSGFFVNTFDQVNFAMVQDQSAITNLPGSVNETGLFSVYTRANYNYKQKYLFSATLRADASSKFGPENRWGYFPSVSAGWVMSEDLFPESDVVDLMKLRASWGINGNDNIANYQYSRSVNPNAGPSFGGNNTTGISTEFLSNPSVKWEEVMQTNVGLDVNLFGNSVGVTVDYYNKTTSDMLVPIGTPAYIGLSSAAANVADVKNSGLELLLTYRQVQSDDLSWSVSGNIGYNKNEVTGLGENGQPLNGGNIGFVFLDPITRTDVGGPIASFYGYQVEEVNAEGELVFKDLDGIPGIDPTDKTVIGNPFPDFTYGLTLDAKFKGFDFNAFFYGSQGNDIYNATTRLDAPFANRPVSYGEEGAPRNLLGGATGTDQTDVSDFYVEDGSFTKLKTLTLGYTLPESASAKIGFDRLRFYVTGQNLLVLTNYTGLDPEIGQAFAQTVLDVGIDRGFYPQPRTVLFGFQLNL
ncbi:TonB-dependent receptor [Pontibacter sp. G13]|uniref:SusC/RagA family TonB-linked outer membrane protein n=1 Tax=Pontibacter sp. G13 TaxID=3074898 RepID=UPI00288A8DFF|nr:TonB-dependent receptor [Pontibacter sp. G13]WNJ16168.1 TonB-dependent receptor [Pontibacter sp. G13]